MEDKRFGSSSYVGSFLSYRTDSKIAPNLMVWYRQDSTVVAEVAQVYMAGS